MFRYTPSLAQKITLGYYTVGVIFIILIFCNIMGLLHIERKIMFSEAISDLFDAVLEVRRYEKNYFLYQKEIDYHEALRYVNVTQSLIDRNRNEFSESEQLERMESLESLTLKYLDVMKQYAELNKKNQLPAADVDVVRKFVIERDIRQTGKTILDLAQDILIAERNNVRNLLSLSRKILMLLALALFILGVVVCQILSRRIVRPLKLIRESMRRIGEGRLESLQLDSKDSEIVSLTNAFNRMLTELQIRQQHLIHSEKMASLGTLLSGVAHELNNPLSNISTSAEILGEEIEEADMEYKRELLEQIEEQTDKARLIVRSLLEFSRNKEFTKESLNLRDLFDSTVRFVKGQIPTKVSIEARIPSDIVIVGDKQRIQQALLNLLINAVDAMDNEGVIQVVAQNPPAQDTVPPHMKKVYDLLRFCKKLRPDEAVDILIRDSGSGIAADELSKIFDPFFTTKEVGRGLGLGLSIVHEIIEDHDGCIVVESEEGKGTTFLMRMPGQAVAENVPR